MGVASQKAVDAESIGLLQEPAVVDEFVLG
jgi:hypothetical protein